MSILSSVYGGLKSVVNSIGSFFGGGSSSQSAAAFQGSLLPGTTIQNGKVVQNQTPAPNMSTPYGPGVSYGSGTAILNKSGQTTGLLAGNGGYAPLPTAAFPSPIYSQPTSILGGQSRSGGGITTGGPVTTGSPSFATSSFTTSPSSITGPSSFSGGASPSGAASPVSGTITSASSAPSSPISLPTKPTYADVGKVNNSHLIPVLGKDYGYNPDTGQFEAKQDSADPAQAQKDALMATMEKTLQQNVPKKDNTLEDPAVMAAQQEVNQRKQEVANYTAQLNAITAKQNQDLLQVRGADSKEGVTEAVYGGQSAEINREAAIQALPVQAQISAAQGNLQLAQDYLTQMTTFTQEKINNEYSYQKDLYGVLSDYVGKAGTDALKTINDNLDAKKKTADENLKTLNQYMLKAAENGQTASISRLSALANSVGDPNFTQYLGNIIGSAPGIAGGGSTSFTGEEKRKLEQADLLNAPRQDQLDYLYGNSSGGLTNSKINTGANNAGLPVDNFKQLPSDVQNYFANSPQKKIGDVQDAIKGVADGSEKADDVKTEIDSSNNTDAVKTYLKSLVDNAAPQDGGGGFWSKVASFF